MWHVGKSHRGIILSRPPSGRGLEVGDLRSAAAHVSRVQAHLSDVVSVEQPAQEPFEAKTKPSMLASSKLPLVSVPVVWGWVQPLFFVGGHQLVHVVHPHTPSHDLATLGIRMSTASVNLLSS